LRADSDEEKPPPESRSWCGRGPWRATVDVINGEAVDDDIPLVEIVEAEVDAAIEGTEFSLQFDSAEIGALGARYSYAEDSDPASAGAAPRRHRRPCRRRHRRLEEDFPQARGER